MRDVVEEEVDKLEEEYREVVIKSNNKLEQNLPDYSVEIISADTDIYGKLSNSQIELLENVSNQINIADTVINHLSEEDSEFEGRIKVDVDEDLYAEIGFTPNGREKYCVEAAFYRTNEPQDVQDVLVQEIGENHKEVILDGIHSLNKIPEINEFILESDY